MNPTSFEPGARGGAGSIPLCVPEIRGNEWAYVKDALDTGWVSSVGAYVDRFEQEMAAYVGVRHAIAVVNGTAALHVALLLAGVRPDDEVLVSDLTFIAPANAIRYAGARPVLVDAEPDYWQMDPQATVAFLERGCRAANGELRNRATGRRVKAIVPVHALGHPVDMDPILEAARRLGVAVIEDATESLGATYKGRKTGALGDLACLSFNGNKLLTTGGGGMILTDDDALARRARYLTTQAKDDPVEYVHQEVGYNYRLTNIQAAVGVAQLERIDAHLAAKRRIADAYARALGDVAGVSPMREAPWARSAWWMCTVLVDPARYGMDRRALLGALAAEGIQARPLWQPMHQSPAHKGTALPLECKTSAWLHDRALSLPCSVGLTHDEQQRVVRAVKGAAKPH